MTRMHRLESLVIEWGAAGVALTGEAESGDLHVVVPFPEGALVGPLTGWGTERKQRWRQERQPGFSKRMPASRYLPSFSDAMRAYAGPVGSP